MHNTWTIMVQLWPVKHSYCELVWLSDWIFTNKYGSANLIKWDNIIWESNCVTSIGPSSPDIAGVVVIPFLRSNTFKEVFSDGCFSESHRHDLSFSVRLRLNVGSFNAMLLIHFYWLEASFGGGLSDNLEEANVSILGWLAFLEGRSASKLSIHLHPGHTIETPQINCSNDVMIWRLRCGAL